MKPVYLILASSSIPFLLALFIGIISWTMLSEKTISIKVLVAMIFYIIPIYVFIILPLYFGFKKLVIKVFKSLKKGIFFIGCILIAILQVAILGSVLGESKFENIFLLGIGMPFLIRSFVNCWGDKREK